jgi:hypothetical protein
VVAGIGVVCGVICLLIANDRTVKGGAGNPWSLPTAHNVFLYAQPFRPLWCWRPMRLPLHGLCVPGSLLIAMLFAR